MTIGNIRSIWRVIDLNWQQRQENSANNSDLNPIQIESFIKDRQPVWGFSGEVCHRRIQGAGVWPWCCQRWNRARQRPWLRCQLTNLSHPFRLICPANVLCIHMHQERHVYPKLYFLVVELISRTSNLPRCLSMDLVHSMCCNLIFFLHPCCFNQALTAKLRDCYLWIVQNLSYSISKEAVLFLEKISNRRKQLTSVLSRVVASRSLTRTLAPSFFFPTNDSDSTFLSGSIKSEKIVYQ